MFFTTHFSNFSQDAKRTQFVPLEIYLFYSLGNEFFLLSHTYPWQLPPRLPRFISLKSCMCRILYSLGTPALYIHRLSSEPYLSLMSFTRLQTLVILPLISPRPLRLKFFLFIATSVPRQNTDKTCMWPFLAWKVASFNA